MSNRPEAVAALQQQLGYRFKATDLLELALTHASVGEGSRKVDDNERLEFLGDRVLGLMVARALCEQLPDADEGTLTKRLHVLVSRPACAQVARAIGLGPALRLPGGETRRGARDQDTILADACEAVIAAVYLDGGHDAAQTLVGRLWGELLLAPIDDMESNPKSQLQEWAAVQGHAQPRYEVVDRAGPDHEPVFTVRLTVGSLAPVTATGRGRQPAEKAAALAMLQRERG